jgi:hypothetical protein
MRTLYKNVNPVIVTMTTLTVKLLSTYYRVILVNKASEYRDVASATGIGLERLRQDIGTNPPAVLGSCYHNRKVVLVCIAGTTNNILGVLKHELAHAIIEELGLRPSDETRNEALANKVAGVFTSTGRVIRSVRLLLDEGGLGRVGSAVILERRADAGKLPYNADELPSGNHMPIPVSFPENVEEVMSITVKNGRIE